MASELRQSQVSVSDLEGQLNYLEYVLENTRKKLVLLKDGLSKEKKESLIVLIDNLQDSIDSCRDEIANQVDRE